MTIKFDPGSAQLKELKALHARLEAAESVVHSSAFQVVRTASKLMYRICQGKEVEEVEMTEAAAALLSIAPTVRSSPETAVRKAAAALQKLATTGDR